MGPVSAAPLPEMAEMPTAVAATAPAPPAAQMAARRATARTSMRNDLLAKMMAKKASVSAPTTVLAPIAPVLEEDEELEPEPTVTGPYINSLVLGGIGDLGVRRRQRKKKGAAEAKAGAVAVAAEEKDSNPRRVAQNEFKLRSAAIKLAGMGVTAAATAAPYVDSSEASDEEEEV